MNVKVARFKRGAMIRMFAERCQLIVMGLFFFHGDGKLILHGGPQKAANLTPRLVALLDHLQDQLTQGSGKIRILSGYRSPQYNEGLRSRGVGAALTSLHTEGMAADFSLQGVEPKKLWENIRTMNCCGAGYYGKSAVHIDTGPPRFWEAASLKVFTDISEHNRQIFPEIEYDIYSSGDRLKFRLVRMTEYPFGVAKKVALVLENGRVWKTLPMEQPDCKIVENKNDAQHFILTLPSGKIPAGKKLKLKMRFCSTPSKEMPAAAISNPFVIAPPQ